MAKNLEVGQSVTVKAHLAFDKTSDTYMQGLQSLEPGVVGKIVAPAEGRAVVVDFNGIQATITRQRLDKVELPKAPARRGRPKGTPKQAKAATPSQLAEGADLPTATAKTAAPTSGSQVITAIANKLLATGRLEPDQETMVELKLADLPDDVQAQIKALIQAKLALSL